MRVFTKAPQIYSPSATTTRSSLHRPRWNSTHQDGMSLLQWHESLFSVLSASFFFQRATPSLTPSPLFSPQGPARKKQLGRGSQHSEMSELTPVVPPCTSLSLPTESFHPLASPARTSISLWLRAIGSHSVEAMTARWTEMDDSLSLVASDAEELSGSYHDPAPLHSA